MNIQENAPLLSNETQVDQSASELKVLFGYGSIVLAIFYALIVILSHHYLLIITATLALVGYMFSLFFARYVLTRDVPITAEMANVSTAIREGAQGFMQTQFKSIAKFAVIVVVMLVAIYYINPLSSEKDVNTNVVPIFTGLCFIFGAVCSALSGYIGMWVSVRSNVRVAGAAKVSYGDAIKIAMRGGTSSGLLVVGMVVIGLSFTHCMARVFFPKLSESDLSAHVVGFGFGASLVALFAQLGGGIYTKAADVGADIVGKIEASIPEDDPRNPAVVADLVGDNVGDCAGRGADLFESISAEIIGAMILGGNLAASLGVDEASFVYFPLLIHSFDLIVSSIGTLCVREMKVGHEGTMKILTRGFLIALLCSFFGFGIACYVMFNLGAYPDAWWRYWLCGVVGMALALCFLLITEFYTGVANTPVQSIAKASTTGHGTNVITGLSVGMESVGAPVVLIAVGIMSSYYIGEWALPGGGMFGTAVATMGMLSIAGFVLGMDTFGPITDNAGGIIEMSGEDEHVRAITDELDAVGNTTKALTKGWAIGSAGLASFLLFNAFVDVVDQYEHEALGAIDFSRPAIFSAGLLGAGLVVVFSSLAMRAVGRAAHDVVKEVRRQFRTYPIMTGQERPRYQECVSLIHQAALREMRAPGVLVIVTPPILGLLYRGIGALANDELLAAKSLAGFLMVATTTGICFSLFLNNAGGAWDNAKKVIETGKFGGKGSDAHKASITGDCVGDPCKDTAGPSIHVLIKMLSTITLVLGPIFLKVSSES